MSIIEQIRAEIERKIENLRGQEKDFLEQDCHTLVEDARARISELNQLLSFLDTLGEKSEKPMQEGLEEEITRTYHDGSVADTTEMDHVDYENIARHFYELGCRRTAEKYDEIEYNRQIAEEKQVNEELEEEIEKCLVEYHMLAVGKRDFSNIARHFAQWGAEHFANPGKTSSGSSEIPNDLKEAAGEYAEKHGFRVPYDGSDNFYDDVDVKASKEGFIAGAEWDRQQGEICKVEVFGIGNTDCLVPLISFNPKSVKPGDKVIVQIRRKI